MSCFHILFSVFSTILLDGIYLELSKNLGSGKWSMTHFIGVTWPQIYLDKINHFPWNKAKLIFYSNGKLRFNIRLRATKILIEENIQ